MTAATLALEHLMAATVRVGSGTGVLVANGGSTVIVTANHVATNAEEPDAAVRVWAAEAWTDCAVLARDAGSDLAIVGAPPALDGVGLHLLARELAPGEEDWTCGHPRGWISVETPVLCRGIVAGVAEERWANLEASWGNSGGALVLVEGDRAVLGGIALGRAGEAHAKLEDLRREAHEDMEGLDAVYASMKSALASMDGFRKVLDEKEARLDTPDEALSKAMAAVLSILTDLVDRHFRTGFVRFASATTIRKLLGDG